MVGALPRPDLPGGPHDDFVEALHELHRQAGWPSLRRLGAEVGCSHTTVSHAFSSPRLPAWGTVELLVEAMGGDVPTIRGLWVRASSGASDDTSTASRMLAGRRAELGVVRRHAETGSGVLLVSGEAGMGKTRLVECAAELAAARARILLGSCLPLSREVPLLPIADILRSAYSLDDGRWVTEALRACPPYVAPSVARLLPEVAPLAQQEDPEDEWSRPRLYSAVASLVVALGEQHPLAVVIEDLHWSDDATLDLLENLVARPPLVPAIVTWRSEDPDVPAHKVEWLRRVQRSPHVTVLALEPLDRAASAEQLEMICGEVSPAAVDRIHARSQGLPLFTEQLATSDGVDLPPLLEDVLVTRLRELDESCWCVARALGIAGRGLPYDVIAATVQLDEARLTAALRELRDRRLLRADHRTSTVELRHPLLGEAVLRMLVPGEAPTEHRRLAQALADDADAPAAEVATHWQAAGAPAEELPWRIRAARDAEARFAKAQAAEQWLRALAIWPDDLQVAGSPSLSRFRATVAAMSALEASSQTRRAAELADGARRRHDLDAAEEAELCMLAADFAGVLDDAETALGLAERAVTLFATLPSGAHRVDSLRTRAWLRQDLGRWEEAMADIELAIEVNTDVGDELQHRRLLAAQGWFDFAAGRRSLGLERISAAARPPAVPDPLGDAYIAMVHSDVLLEVGAPASEVAAATERALRVADELHIDSQLVSTARSNTAEAWLLAGDVERAARAVGRAADGEFRHERWALHLTRAEIDIARGDLVGAQTRLDEIMRHQLGAQASQDYLGEVRTKLLLWSGRPVEAWDCARSVLDRWVSQGSHVHAGAMPALAARAAAEAAVAAGDSRAVADVTALMDVLEDLVLASDDDHVAAAVAQTYDAEVARGVGRDTTDMWVAAGALFDRVRRPHPAAYCRWRGAQAAIRSGRRTVASGLIDAALRDARQHLPLTTAVLATAASGGAGGRLGADGARTLLR